jgi:hypothetical protein
MYRNLFLPLLILALSLTAFSQIEPKPTPKSDETEKLEANALELLKETSADVNNLRSLPNRIGFSAELASLMWFHDESKAKAMYGGVVSDFRELLARYTADLNAFSETATPGESNDPTDRMLVEKRMQTAIMVGQQITNSIAEHDPELALNFYFDSIAAISNPEFRERIEGQSSYFEAQLLGKVLEKNPAKAVPFAKRSLARSGFGSQHIDLLRNLYAKDPDAAAAFGEAVIDTLKTKRPEPHSFWAVSSLIGLGSETIRSSKEPGGKRPVFTESQLRDLSDMFGEILLSASGEHGPEFEGFVVQIEPYAPGRARQIRAKFGLKKAPTQSTTVTSVARDDMDEDEAPDVSKSPEVTKIAEMQATEKTKKEDQMTEDIKKLGNKELPAEERDRIVAQARKIIAATPGRENKISALCFLASQVRLAGDKELAASILKDAASFVNPQPKNYQDFLLTWVLATGYASADPDAAFPLLEDTISRVNETIEAFVKVGEFIDISGEIIDDGEVQVGALGAAAVRSFTGELAAADITLQMLARADFAKTRGLTNKFDRPEVRVLAKMLVIRSLLGPKTPIKPPMPTTKTMTISSNEQ